MAFGEEDLMYLTLAVFVVPVVFYVIVKLWPSQSRLVYRLTGWLFITIAVAYLGLVGLHLHEFGELMVPLKSQDAMAVPATAPLAARILAIIGVLLWPVIAIALGIALLRAGRVPPGGSGGD